MFARARTFERIYRTNAWNGEGTRAGPGSSLAATERLRVVIPKVLAGIGASSVLDAACGDSLWMTTLPGYIGVDIVGEAVRVARLRHPGRDYRVADICRNPLPHTDAIICRDAMQHMSFADGLAALGNFRRTGARWLLASTHMDTINMDVPTGDYYQINLQAPPFLLGEPLWSVPDGEWEGQTRYPHKLLGLWSL